MEEETKQGKNYLEALIADARIVNGITHPTEKAKRFKECLDLAIVNGNQKQILYCSANYNNAQGVCLRNKEEFEQAIDIFSKAEEEFLKLNITKSAYFCAHQALNCAQQLHDIESYQNKAENFIKRYALIKRGMAKQDLLVYNEIENNLSRIKEFRKVPINKKLELLTNESLTRLIETSYICIQHSPQTIPYLLGETETPAADFKPQVRAKIDLARRLFVNLKEAKIEPVIKAFENLKNFSRIKTKEINGIIIDIGNTSYSRYWGEDIRTLTIAIDRFEKAFTFRTKNANLGECKVGDKIKLTNIGVIPEFSRLFSLKNYNINIYDLETDILQQFPEYLLINIDDECRLLKSYSLEDFVIDPLSEELCNFFVSPIRITKVSSYKAMGFFVLDLNTHSGLIKAIIQIRTFRDVFGEKPLKEVEDGLKGKYFLTFCQGIYTGPNPIEEKTIQVLSIQEIDSNLFEKYFAYSYFRFRRIVGITEVPSNINIAILPKEIAKVNNKWYFIPSVFKKREEFIRLISESDKEDIKDINDSEIRMFLLANPSFFDVYKRYYHHYTDADLNKKFEWPIKESKSLLKNFSRKVVEVSISDFSILVYWDTAKKFDTIDEAFKYVKEIKPTEMKFILSSNNSTLGVLNLIRKNLRIYKIPIYYYGSKSEGNLTNHMFRER